MLRRNPGFSAAVILTLALGIAMSTAMFSAMNAVLLQRLSYPDANRLIWIAQYDPGYQSENDYRLLPSDYAAFQQASSFESMAAYNNEDLALVYGAASASERIASITGGFWSMTGVQPALGRLFHAGEPQAIVLSWRLFERRFGCDPRVIGKTVAVEGHPFEITGVLPARFHLLFPQFLYPDDERKEIDAYIGVPDAGLHLPFAAYQGTNWDLVLEKLGPTPDFVWIVGKLKPLVPLDRGRAELATIYRRLAAQSPTVYHTHSALRVQPMQSKLTRNVRPAFLVFAGAVSFVLLIVCANVANLLLARASSRSGEVAIRRALGAGRPRLIRQFLTESILFAAGGAVAGAVLAKGILAVMLRLGSPVVPRLVEARIDGRVLLFTLAVSLAFLFGFGPAISLLRSDTRDPLTQNASTSSAGLGRARLRALLVAVEVALAIVLLSGAGLMLKSFWRMNAFPAGFSPDKILVAKISLSGARYRTWPQQHAYIDELFRRIATVPEVQAAGIHCATFNTSIHVEGAGAEDQTFAAIEYVSPGYLQALGISLVAGRWPSENEALDVVLVNRSFARRATAQGDLIGKRIHAAFLSATVAGIVPDFKTSQLDAEPGPAVFAAYPLSPRISFVTAMIRMDRNPALDEPAIRKLISGIDQNVPADRISTLEHELADSIAPRRLNLFLLISFAAAALLLASIGIYGVIAYLVAQRRRELGIRLALGAQRFELMQMVLRQGLAIVMAGVTAGSLAALGLNRLMSSLLYGVKPNDPSTLMAVAAALILVALLACSGPALKAARVDPLIALRYE
jgi:putative ABC transport system permease protein